MKEGFLLSFGLNWTSVTSNRKTKKIAHENRPERRYFKKSNESKVGFVRFRTLVDFHIFLQIISGSGFFYVCVFVSSLHLLHDGL